MASAWWTPEMELRCPHGIKFAVLTDGIIEVKCRSSRCGAGPGIVVLHRFDALTGEMIETLRFRDPRAALSIERSTDGTEHDPATVRTP